MLLFESFDLGYFLPGKFVISESILEALSTVWSRGVKKCLFGRLSFDNVSFNIFAMELKSFY